MNKIVEKGYFSLTIRENRQQKAGKPLKTIRFRNENASDEKHLFVEHMAKIPAAKSRKNAGKQFL